MPQLSLAFEVSLSRLVIGSGRGEGGRERGVERVRRQRCDVEGREGEREGGKGGRREEDEKFKHGRKR